MFITIEGVDGAGKSTLVEGLYRYLLGRQYPVIKTREPGGSPVAEKLRAIALSTKVSPLTELYMFAAARADHCSEIIIPSMLSGTWVLCDRFHGSTYVYQYKEKKVSLRNYSLVKQSILDLFTAEGIDWDVPHLEIILDVPYEIAIERLGTRNEGLNILDTLDSSVFNARRNAFIDYAALSTNNAFIIDAVCSSEQVLHMAKQKIEAELNSDL